MHMHGFLHLVGTRRLDQRHGGFGTAQSGKLGFAHMGE
jgi:hypothetical protein